MIVDQVDGAPEGHATVNVSSHFCYKGMYLVIEHCPSTQGREAENGNAFRPGRRCDPGEHLRINAVGIPSKYYNVLGFSALTNVTRSPTPTTTSVTRDPARLPTSSYLHDPRFHRTCTIPCLL